MTAEAKTAMTFAIQGSTFWEEQAQETIFSSYPLNFFIKCTPGISWVALALIPCFCLESGPAPVRLFPFFWRKLNQILAIRWFVVKAPHEVILVDSDATLPTEHQLDLFAFGLLTLYLCVWCNSSSQPSWSVLPRDSLPTLYNTIQANHICDLSETEALQQHLDFCPCDPCAVNW